MRHGSLSKGGVFQNEGNRGGYRISTHSIHSMTSSGEERKALRLLVLLGMLSSSPCLEDKVR